MPDRDVLSDRPERHDPLTCELCHWEGVSAELVSLRAENEHLRAGVSWVRGMCSDEEPYAEIDHTLGEILAGSSLPTDEIEAGGDS